MEISKLRKQLENDIFDAETQLKGLRDELQSHEFNLKRLAKRSEELELGIAELAGYLRGLKGLLGQFDREVDKRTDKEIEDGSAVTAKA